jgi:sugar phosphate isomerase/epimerase
VIEHEFPEDVSLLEFPGFVKESYGLGLVELCQMHFPTSERGYLDELRGRIAEVGCRVVNVPVDVGNISEPRTSSRQLDLENVKRWMDVAAYIGSPCVRVNSGHQPEGQEDIGITVASYKELAAHASELGIRVLLENHGGISADPENIRRLIASVGSDRFRLCPDFGNFDERIRYEALRTMLPYAEVAHAKTWGFDGNGMAVGYDFARVMSIVHECSYEGPLSVEFEGEGDQYDGVRKTVALLQRYL